jgi:AmiR/NasT family two-component response regulator
MDTRHELLARILDVAASIKKLEDQLRRTTHDLCKRFAECTEVDRAIYGHLF